MITVLISCLFGIASVAVVIAMTKTTNRKILVLTDAETKKTPYTASPTAYTALAGILFVSALCGALISKYAISGIAIVKLGICYLAILGAAVIDYKLRIIPNYIPLTLVATWVLIFIYESCFGNGSVQTLIASTIGCLLCFLMLLLGNKFSKGGIGGGDIKLLSCVGLMCGAYTVFTTLLLALICCCIFAAASLLTKKMTLKNSVPFGPFIYLGYVLMCLMTLY